MEARKLRKTSEGGNAIEFYQRCTKCAAIESAHRMIAACPDCAAPLEFVFEGTYSGAPSDRDDLWKNFDLLPLEDSRNIVALGAGGSPILELPELGDALGGADLFLKLDSDKNPTGTFKDREASVILSRCKELGLDGLVFYSTANTGRAYTHYAAELGLTSYFFMPKQCEYKNTGFQKGPRNHLILVDSHYPNIGPYAKRFAKENGLHAIAPLHERTESYATLAYEQFQEMPDCDFFVQTIASGMGPIGFLRGHRNLIKFGLEERRDVPRIVCVQSEQTNSMYVAYRAGKTEMTPDDLPSEFPDDLFEPTLNSTNPVHNYPALCASLRESDGIITDVGRTAVGQESGRFLKALAKRGIRFLVEQEQSTLIGFAGLVRLAAEGSIGRGDRVLLLATGRGGTESSEIVPADLTIDPSTADPVEVKRRLDVLTNE